MADVERTLIAKAINSGEFNDLMGRGIEPEHFADPECREVYEFALDFMRIHVDAPSRTAIRDEFPKFKAPVSQDPLSYHMERFILKVKERMAIELVREFHDAIDDPERVNDIEIHALEMARMLTDVVPAPRESRYSDAPSRIKEYRRKEREGTNPGIFLGIPALDKEMLGIQPHELVAIVAYLGVGKSTLMKKIAYSAYLQNKTSLIVSLEEEADAVLRKIDVMASNVRYWAMKAMELGVGDMKKWEEIAERADADRHERDIIIIDDIQNCSVDHVMSRILRYKPDVTLVDYLELMKSPRGVVGWEAISQNGMGLKQIARVLKIPIVTAAQLNRDGGKGDVTLANVSHQSVGKHSDVLIGLAQDEEKESQQEMDVILLKNRDGKKTRTTMRWALETMDIRQKGTEELFPKRNVQSMMGHERRKERRLEIAREVASASPSTQNPWKKRGKPKSNPFTAKVAA